MRKRLFCFQVLGKWRGTFALGCGLGMRDGSGIKAAVECEGCVFCVMGGRIGCAQSRWSMVDREGSGILRKFWRSLANGDLRWGMWPNLMRTQPFFYDSSHRRCYIRRMKNHIAQRSKSPSIIVVETSNLTL